MVRASGVVVRFAIFVRVVEQAMLFDRLFCLLREERLGRRMIAEACLLLLLALEFFLACVTAADVLTFETVDSVSVFCNDINLVDPASSHTLVSKIKPCMSKYKQLCTVKLRMAHYISYSLLDSTLLLG